MFVYVYLYRYYIYYLKSYCISVFDFSFFCNDFCSFINSFNFYKETLRGNKEDAIEVCENLVHFLTTKKLLNFKIK